MEDNGHNYELMNGDNPTPCSRILSCLNTYTIGSCLYFKNDSEAPDDEEEKPIELETLPRSHRTKQHKRVLGESDNERKRKDFLKADCKMKKRVQFHFDDHIKKWINRPDQRRFPWKIILHLVLLVLVTTQVIC